MKRWGLCILCLLEMLRTDTTASSAILIFNWYFRATDMRIASLAKLRNSPNEEGTSR